MCPTTFTRPFRTTNPETSLSFPRLLKCSTTTNGLGTKQVKATSKWPASQTAERNSRNSTWRRLPTRMWRSRSLRLLRQPKKWRIWKSAYVFWSTSKTEPESFTVPLFTTYSNIAPTAFRRFPTNCIASIRRFVRALAGNLVLSKPGMPSG